MRLYQIINDHSDNHEMTYQNKQKFTSEAVFTMYTDAGIQILMFLPQVWSQSQKLYEVCNPLSRAGCLMPPGYKLRFQPYEWTEVKNQ
jgi:hypothetical protein